MINASTMVHREHSGAFPHSRPPLRGARHPLMPKEGHQDLQARGGGFFDSRYQAELKQLHLLGRFDGTA